MSRMFLWIDTRQSVDKNNRWPHSHLLTHLLTQYQSCFYVLQDGEAASAQFFTISMG